MTRDEMVVVVREIEDLLEKKKVTRKDAERIAYILGEEIKKKNEANCRKYMNEDIYCKNSHE